MKVTRMNVVATAVLALGVLIAGGPRLLAKTTETNKVDKTSKENLSPSGSNVTSGASAGSTDKKAATQKTVAGSTSDTHKKAKTASKGKAKVQSNANSNKNKDQQSTDKAGETNKTNSVQHQIN